MIFACLFFLPFLKLHALTTYFELNHFLTGASYHFINTNATKMLAAITPIDCQGAEVKLYIPPSISLA